MGQRNSKDNIHLYLSVEEVNEMAPDILSSLDEEAIFNFCKQLYLLSEVIYEQFKKQEKESFDKGF